MSIKKTYGLIGKNIDYSFSVKYFGQKFQEHYRGRVSVKHSTFDHKNHTLTS